jgi:hypothetical protein
MKLAISLATRGRPEKLIENVKKTVSNWTDPNTVMWIMADDDDLPTIYACNEAFGRDGPVKLNIRPREDVLAAKWNRIVKLEPKADLYVVDADDTSFITSGYDSRLLDAAKRFPDGIGLVYGHMANASFTGIEAPTRGFVEKFGGIFPEYFPYWFCDHWVDDIARIIDRISFADVRTDQSNVGMTQEMREPAWWGTWFDAAYLFRRKQAHAIINSPDFKEPKWRKEILLTHHPIIEYRSKWINDNLRGNQQAFDRFIKGKPDERYLRVKDAAIAMLPQILEGVEPAIAAAYRNTLVPQKFVPALAKLYA